jgi:hypothetical protein
MHDTVGRIRRLVFSPATEWDAIDREPADPGDLYLRYVLPLVVVAALAGAIGQVWDHSPLILVVRRFLLSVVLAAAAVFILALIINGLATLFEAQKSAPQALKVAAYAPTAAWIASLFYIAPAIDVLTILGLYSAYLLYVGLPKLMKCPKPFAMMYALTAIACTFVVMLIIGYLVVPIVLAPTMMV